MEEIEILDCVNNFKNFYECVSEENKEGFSEKDMAYIWFSSCVCDCTFYDYGLDLEWGEKLYKTIKAITDRTQSELMEEMYKDYIICLNLIGVTNFEWGSSIRYCWFENADIENRFKESIKQIKDIVEKE